MMQAMAKALQTKETRRMNLIDQLDKRGLVELLGKCWMTHDGMWFFNTFSQFGIESANKVNKLAIQSLAPIEVRRFKKAMGFSKEAIESFEELRSFFSNVADLLIPDFMNVKWTFPDQDILHWEFSEKGCFAYNGVKMLGVIDEYECGPLFRIGCWLKEIGVDYKVDPKIDKCIFPTKKRCAGYFEISIGQQV
jgi:hypothetical protein